MARDTNLGAITMTLKATQMALKAMELDKTTK